MGSLPGDLNAHKPSNDGSHLKIGISPPGMVAFLRVIGFLANGSHIADKKWPFKCTLEERDDAMAWADKLYGRIEDGFVTGYDICAYVRDWAKRFGYDKLSVVEIILIDENLKALRQFVGPAKVFLSHVQVMPSIGQSPISPPSVLYRRHVRPGSAVAGPHCHSVYQPPAPGRRSNG